MTKAVLSNRIMLNTNPDLVSRIVKDLTHKIPAKSKYDFPETIKTWSRMTSNVYSIPVGRLDIVPKDYEIIDKRVMVPVAFPKFKFTLRPSQQQVFDAVTDNCIINAAPSYGKTFTALAIAAKLQQKTLVVTHTTMLRDQWVNEVEKVFGIKPGIIGTGKFNTDSPIVIANIQTLVKHVSKIEAEFGLTILDEAHHTPASTFSLIIDKMKSRYKIGLTGTLERKDGKHVVLFDYFGYTIHKPPEENAGIPTVAIYKLPILFKNTGVWANDVTELEVFNEDYQKAVCQIADSAAKNGHKVLVVGSRVEFLTKAPTLCSSPAVAITGEIKDMKERLTLLDRVESEFDIIFGTASIFSEGISQNSLSCLILATPINNEPLLIQLIGRVIRLKEGKQNPLVIDLNLNGNIAKHQAKERYSLYLKKGYKIKILT